MKEYVYEWINIIGKENIKLKVDSYLDAKPRTQRKFSKEGLRQQIEVDIRKVNKFFEGNEKLPSKTIKKKQPPNSTYKTTVKPVPVTILKSKRHFSVLRGRYLNGHRMV